MTNSSENSFNSHLGHADTSKLVLNEEDEVSVEDVNKYLKGVKVVAANKA